MDQTRHGKRLLDRMDSPTTTTTECTLDESTSSSSSSFSVGTPILSMRFCKVQVPPQLWRKETDDGCTTADNTLCDTPTVLQIPLDAFCGVDDEEPTIVVRGVNDHHDEDADLAVHQTTVAKGPSLAALKRAIVEASAQAGLPHTAARLHESLSSSSSRTTSSWGLRYRDREGDVVSITSNAVLYHALLDYPNHSSSTLRLELIVPPSLLRGENDDATTRTTATTTSVEETLLRQLQEELHAGLQAQQHVLNALMEQVQELKQQQQAQAQQQTQTAESSPRSLVVHNSNDTSSTPSNNNKSNNNNTSLLTMTPSLSAKEKIAVLLEAARGGPARLVSSSSLSSSSQSPSSSSALERVQQRRVDWERTTQYMESLRLEVGILKEILKRERDLSHGPTITSRSSRSTTKNRRSSLRRMRWMVAVTTSPTTTVVASEEAVPLSSPRRPAHPRGAWMSRFWNHHNTVPSN